MDRKHLQISIKNLIRHPYWEALCIPLLLLTHRLYYELIGELLSQNSIDFGQFLISPWDRDIPFVPFFVLPYLFTWAYGAIIFLYAIITDTYYKYVFRCFYLSILLETAAECLIWYNFPASIQIRVAPEILNRCGWLGSLTAYVYDRATPWNVIPSAHIAFSYTVWLFSKHFAKKNHRLLFLFLFILIALSVVFIKNHYLVDIAGGMALGQIIYQCVFLPALKSKILNRFPTSAVLGFYFLVFLLSMQIYKLALGYSWRL